MNDEGRFWLEYANENLQSAEILLKSHLYNPCLQNIQQSVEKALKALLLHQTGSFPRTHDILTLRELLIPAGLEPDITPESCQFLNTIYLPSKYPIGSVIPDFDPDEDLCRETLKIAVTIMNYVSRIME